MNTPATHENSSHKVYLEESFTPLLTPNGHVIVDQRIFSAKSISKKANFLKSLAASRTGILRREDLIAALYGELMIQHPNVVLRSTTAKYHSALKTISRLRIELEKFFGDLAPPNFDWLPWSEKLGGWILFRRGYIENWLH